MNFKLVDSAAIFNSYIDTNIPNTTGDFKLIHDYTVYKNDYTKYPIIRAMTTVINWKSNVNNADITYNFRTKLNSGIHRGDLIYDDVSKKIGIINWNADSVVDCIKTQITTCNTTFEFKRRIPEVVDNTTGMLVTEAYDGIIVNSTPCIYTEMFGRYEYEIVNNTPGIIQDQYIEVRLQYNTESKNLMLGDFFDVKGTKYKIMILSKSQVVNEQGILVLTCDRSVA